MKSTIAGAAARSAFVAIAVIYLTGHADARAQDERQYPPLSLDALLNHNHAAMELYRNVRYEVRETRSEGGSTWNICEAQVTMSGDQHRIDVTWNQTEQTREHRMVLLLNDAYLLHWTTWSVNAH